MTVTAEPTVTLTHADLALLHQKIDALTDQLAAQRRREEELAELRQDLVPIINHMIKLLIDELAEIDNDFQLEDLLYLFKRLLRDIPLLLNMLGTLESVADLGTEVQQLIHPVFNRAVESLDELEQKGYFRFAAGLWYILERITDEFTEEDVRELGNNVVTILKTVRNMTQPEVMALANDALARIEDPVPNNVSTWALLRAMRDPQVRRGMARMLNVVKTFADEPEPSES